MLGSILFMVMTTVFTINNAEVSFMACSYNFQNSLGFSIVVWVALIIIAPSTDTRMLAARLTVPAVLSSSYLFRYIVNYQSFSDNRMSLVIEYNKAQKRSQKHSYYF
jgi:hypothetical protein